MATCLRAVVAFAGRCAYLNGLIRCLGGGITQYAAKQFPEGNKFQANASGEIVTHKRACVECIPYNGTLA